MNVRMMLNTRIVEPFKEPSSLFSLKSVHSKWKLLQFVSILLASYKMLIIISKLLDTSWSVIEHGNCKDGLGFNFSILTLLKQIFQQQIFEELKTYA